MKELSVIIREFLVASDPGTVTGSLDAELAVDGTSFSVGVGEGAAFKAYLWPVKIGGEVLLVTRSGDDFTVDSGVGGRGRMATTAAIHLASATVTEATFSDIVGEGVLTDGPRDNNAPQVWIISDDEDPIDTLDVFDVSVEFRCFGGSDDPRDPKTVYRLLYERLNASFGEDTTSGHINSAMQVGAGRTRRDPGKNTNWWFKPVDYEVTLG